MKAYPFIHKHPTTGNTRLEEGMDLRDWFAGLAMQAMVSRGSVNYEDMAEYSYDCAQSLMRERAKRND